MHGEQHLQAKMKGQRLEITVRGRWMLLAPNLTEFDQPSMQGKNVTMGSYLQ